MEEDEKLWNIVCPEFFIFSHGFSEEQVSRAEKKDEGSAVLRWTPHDRTGAPVLERRERCQI